MAYDEKGYLYFAGEFSGNANFGSETHPYNLNTSESAIFISRFKDTKCLWAKKISGVLGVTAIDTDTSGNIYIAGNFLDSVDFDPGKNKNIVFSKRDVTDQYATFDIFLAKFNKEGQLVWVNNIGGNKEDIVMDITVDEQDNVFLTGSYEGTVYFGIGNEGKLSTKDGANGFVAKYDRNGGYRWCFSIGEAGHDDEVVAVTTDNEGYLWVTGHIRYYADLDPGEEKFISQSNVSANIFLAKYDLNRNFIWGYTFRTMGDDGVSDIKVDPDQQVVVTGYFTNRIDLTTDAANFAIEDDKGEHNSFGRGQDIFIAQFDSDGNYLWSRQPDGWDEDESTSLAVNDNGDIFIAGFFHEYISFKDSFPAINLMVESDEHPQGFIAQYTSKGACKSVVKLPQGGKQTTLEVALVGENEVCSVGSFIGEFMVSSRHDSVTLSSKGKTDIFILNYVWKTR